MTRTPAPTSSAAPQRADRARGRLRRVVVGASALAIVGSASALAGSGTTTATGPSGAQYALTVTCATRSATARAALQNATAFRGFTLADDAGNRDPITYTVNGEPATTGAQDWVFSTYLDSAGSGYRIDEPSSQGPDSPVVGAVPTTDCPAYAGFGARFSPVTPTRILDTRPESAIGYDGAKPGASTFVEVQVTGKAGIPPNAVAVALNVTMADASSAGFVQAFPTGRATPGSSSNVNAQTAGQTIPNSVVVPIGDGGRITLFTNAGTHLLADVAGYFVGVSTPVTAGRFVAVTPRRVLDTRAESALNYTGATPAAGATVSLDPVTAAALPVGQVAAVVINVTATRATAAGFVQVAPGGALVPGANSNLNLDRVGQTIPNMVIVPVSASGRIDLYTQRGTELIVDVLGWFTNANAPVSTSGLYFPVDPERVLDTRPDTAVNFKAERRPVLGETSKPGAGAKVDVYFDGLPSGQVGAVILNLTATEATADGFVQGAAQNALTPGASSNLNVERAGQTIANAAILPVSNRRGIALYTQNGTNLIADVGGFFRI